MVAVLGGKRDPGYWETARMLLESGLCLALQVRANAYIQGFRVWGLQLGFCAFLRRLHNIACTPHFACCDL